jgi:hypothetical protein
VCWGHATGVTQDETRTFTGNWTGGTIAGAGDDETLSLTSGQQSVSDPWALGAGEARINVNDYKVGDTPTTIEYKTGDSQATCEADAWNVYDGTSFTSLGWVQIRLTG